MYLKRYSGLFFVSASLFLPFAIMSAALIHFYMRSTGRELLNAWQQSEAINIQEGNLLSAVANHKRVLLSSNMVTSLALLDMEVHAQPHNVLSQFGEQFKIPELGSKNIPIARPINQYIGIFHERVYFRFQDSPNLILIFDMNPDIAWSFFAGLQALLFGVVVASLIFLSSVIRREEEKRIVLIKKILSSIVNSTSGGSQQPIASEIPMISATWLELKTVLEDFSREVSRNSRNLAIAEITRSLAHDLRAPLGTFEHLLASQNVVLPPTMRDMASESLKRLYSMIESLRFSETESIPTKKMTQIDFSFGQRSLSRKADEKGLQFTVPYEQLTDVLVDPMKIERAWINLALNAIEVANSFVRVEIEKQGKNLYIRVIDDGPGVPAEILPRLFGRGVTFGKANGSGLGLAYVKQVVQGHGGEVNYKREDGLTVFECYLPGAFIAAEAADSQYCEKFTKGSEADHVRQVIAILLVPKSLSEMVCKSLSEFGDLRYTFQLDKPDVADLIVTNDLEISSDLLERDLNVVDVSPKLSHQQLVERLKNKLEIK